MKAMTKWTHDFRATVCTVAACAAALTGMSANAQSTLDTTNFPQSVVQFFSENPTNLTWLGAKLEFETAAAYQQNIQFANTIKAGYNLTDYFQLGGKIENAGIGGTVEAYQFSLAYAIINSYAIKLEAGIEPGYNHQYACPVIEPYAAFKKKMTDNTYTFFSISEPIYTRTHGVPSKWTPAFYLGAGFTY